MTIEIRPVQTDEEWRQHSFIAAYAFNGDRGDEARDRKGEYYQWDWTLAAFDGGEMAAGLVIVPFEQYINGGQISVGGIASVSCLPERRRGGHVSALLRQSLATMRDAGQVLSLLGTPHFSLYRKYGYEIAGRQISYAFPPKTTRLRLPAPRGSFRRVTADEWQVLDALHAAHFSSRNGAFARSEPRWRTQIFHALGKQHDAVVWVNAAGEPRGYAVYRTANRPAPSMPWGETTLRVEDWVALDADAYAAILQYLLNHDLVHQIVLLTSSDEPFADAFEEPFHIKEPPGAWLGHMLRLVDVPRALEARPVLPQAWGHSVTIALTDESAPWNAGTWHIECAEGRMSAERTATAPQLEMDVRALAPIYNGHTKPVDALRVGTLRANDPAAVKAATQIFATTYVPYCPDDF